MTTSDTLEVLSSIPLVVFSWLLYFHIAGYIWYILFFTLFFIPLVACFFLISLLNCVIFIWFHLILRSFTQFYNFLREANTRTLFPVFSVITLHTSLFQSINNNGTKKGTCTQNGLSIAGSSGETVAASYFVRLESTCQYVEECGRYTAFGGLPHPSQCSCST